MSSAARAITGELTPRRPQWLTIFLDRFLSGAALIVLIAVFSILAPGFFSVSNFLSIANQVSIVGIIAIGMTLVIVTSGIDLSVGSLVAFSACVAALLMHTNDPPFEQPGLLAGMPWLALVAGVLAGGALGWVNGVLITRLGITPFIITLGMMSIARGASLVMTEEQPVNALPESVFVVGNGSLGPVPIPAIILLALAAIMAVILSRTRLGRYAYALGSNEEAVRLSGVNADAYKTWIYVIMGLLCGVAGAISIGRVSSAEPNAALGYELDAIAAVVIGGASLMGGRGTIVGTLLGIAIMGVLRSGLVFLNVSTAWQQLVIGGVVILAVWIDQLRQGR
ncbi:MAG: ABC transporter permease [Candidatus Sericytochromatia bacterium]|nr:ABC transporter permease [Candidatus Tanganyikabacteria bacterium]